MQTVCLGKMGAWVSYLKGTPGPSGFGSASTAEDVTAGLDLHNYTAIVTGFSFISSRLPPFNSTGCIGCMDWMYGIMGPLVATFSPLEQLLMFLMT